MMRHARPPCPAVILATRPLGEADLLVVLLTPEAGKVRCAARNARRSKRRFPSGLSGGALGHATIASGRSSLLRLDGFTSIRDMSGIGRDLEKFAYVSYLCEVTDALVTEPEADPRRFAALADAIGELLDAPVDPSILRRFELRLLDTLGLLPALDHCCVCGAEVGSTASDSDSISFSVERGGALCSEHGHVQMQGSMPSAALRWAKALLSQDQAEAARDGLAAAPPSVRRGLRDLTAWVIRAQLRRPLRSLEFFTRLDSSAPARDR